MNKTVVGTLRVRDIMSRDLVSIRAGETIHEALKLMVENRVSALPVVDQRDQCVGILSTSDIVDLTQHFDDQWTHLESEDLMSGWSVIERVGRSFGHELVDDVMSDEIAVIEPEADLAEAASCMLRNRVHRLPVVSQLGKVIGIIATTDLLSAFAAGT